MIINLIDARISALSALDGIDVGYAIADLNAAGEAVSIVDTGGIPTLAYTDSTVVTEHSFTIEVYARHPGRFMAMREAIAGSLHGFHGTLSSTRFLSMTLLSDIPSVADQQGRVLRAIMNFDATVEE